MRITRFEINHPFISEKRGVDFPKVLSASTTDIQVIAVYLNFSFGSMQMFIYYF
jgi:hypothetical protein